MYVMHVITSLDIGGAEVMLRRLIESQLRKAEHRHTVISLKSIGKVGQQLRDLGIEVQSLEMNSPLDLPRAFWQLAEFIRKRQPDIVQTWLYHADLLGGVAARLAGNRRVIWSLRCTDLPHRRLSTTQMVVTLCGLLSRYIPQVMVCCAESARRVHEARGYTKDKMTVIPNGYDLSSLRRTEELTRQSRAAFSFDGKTVVVGIIGRFDPQKDYRSFVQAASFLARKNDEVKFLMVGRGIDATNGQLQSWLAEGDCAPKFVLASERSDIPKVLAALDVLCVSSSCGEAFPNVVCEAMAMEVPCVVTDVGDAARIVADTGIVVPPRDANALAEGLQAMISRGKEERLGLGKLARQRIAKHYSIEAIAAQYAAVYFQLIGEQPGGPLRAVVTD